MTIWPKRPCAPERRAVRRVARPSVRH